MKNMYRLLTAFLIARNIQFFKTLFMVLMSCVSRRIQLIILLPLMGLWSNMMNVLAYYFLLLLLLLMTPNLSHREQSNNDSRISCIQIYAFIFRPKSPHPKGNAATVRMSSDKWLSHDDKSKALLDCLDDKAKSIILCYTPMDPSSLAILQRIHHLRHLHLLLFLPADHNLISPYLLI